MVLWGWQTPGMTFDLPSPPLPIHHVVTPGGMPYAPFTSQGRRQKNLLVTAQAFAPPESSTMRNTVSMRSRRDLCVGARTRYCVPVQWPW